MFLFEVKRLIWSALEIEFLELHFLQPVLGSHPVLSGVLAIPRWWPLNTGLTVLTKGKAEQNISQASNIKFYKNNGMTLTEKFWIPKVPCRVIQASTSYKRLLASKVLNLFNILRSLSTTSKALNVITITFFKPKSCWFMKKIKEKRFTFYGRLQLTLYTLWFNYFILGLYFLFLCFGVWWCMIMSLKQRKIKFKPSKKLNHNT